MRDVVLVVDPAGDCRDGDLRDDLLHEDDAAPGLVAALAADVEPQVDLLEIAMKRDRHAEDAHAEEEEAYHAEERLAVPGIDFRSTRRTEDGRIDLVVQHEEMPPFGGEKATLPIRPRSSAGRRASSSRQSR